ncbi:Annexin-like protein [Drosera capensis]
MATLKAPENADAVADAEALRKACQGFGIDAGWGTDEKSIISIIGHRNAAQRKQIREAYQQLYNEDIVSRFEKELSGEFERAVYRWMLDPLDRDALLAHVAMKKGDYQVIVELSCMAAPEELLALRRAYQARYQHSLEEDLASHTSSEMRKAKATDPKLAEAEAEILHNCVKEKEYKHDEIIRILGTRNKAQLVATFYRYRDVYGASINKNLSIDKGDEYVAALQTAIRCIKSPKKYLEKVVRDAIRKSKTDEEVLTRVIVTRADRDLAEIKELFYKRNSIPLEKAIAKETSGDYKAILLTLVGAEDH